MSARTTAEKLRAAIEQSGITQHELARRSGVGQEGISRYVCGKREPSDDTLFRLADALHIPAEALRGVRKKDPRVGTRIAEAVVRLVDLDCTEVRLDKNGDYMIVFHVGPNTHMQEFLKKVARARRIYDTAAIDEDMYLDLVSGLTYKYNIKRLEGE